MPELARQEPVRAEHLHRELLQVLVGLAAEHLLDRALGAGLGGAEEPREAPVADEPQHLDLDVRLREALADERVANRAAIVGRPNQPLEASPDPALEGEGPDRPALVRQDAHRDLPAGAGLADQPIGGHLDAVEEHLGELGLAGHLPQRPDGDAGAAHVDQEQREPLVLRRLRLGPAEEEAPVGDVRVARPDLLPAHHESVAVPLGARAQRGQVRAGAGLGEALAPELAPREERAKETIALLGAAVLQDRGADQIDGGRCRGTRRARVVQLLVEEPALDHRRAPSPVGARPGDRRPAALEEHALPVARDLEPGGVVGPRPAMIASPRAWEVRVEPGAGLGGEGKLGVGEGEVHVRPSRRSTLRAAAATGLPRR